MERTQTTIRIEESLIEDIDREAEKRGISRSEYIRRILRERDDKPESLREEREESNAPFFVKWYRWWRED